MDAKEEIDAVEGEPLPLFDLPTDDGTRVTNSDYAGKILVLYLYPRDDTSGCTQEALDFAAALEDFKKAGAGILGVSKDSIKSHARFKAKHGLPFPLASDESGAFVEALGAWVEKSMYGRRYMGIDRSTFLVGRDGRVVKSWRKVKIPNHVNQVLTAVQSIA